MCTWLTEKTGILIENVGDFFNRLPELIGFALGFAIGKIVQWGTDAWNYLCTNVPIWIESVSDWFSELPGKIKEWLNNTITKLKEWVSDGKKKAKEFTDEFGKKLSTWFKELPSKFKQWGEDALNGLLDGFRNIAGSITSFFSGLWGSITSGFNSTKSTVSGGGGSKGSSKRSLLAEPIMELRTLGDGISSYAIETPEMYTGYVSSTSDVSRAMNDTYNYILNGGSHKKDNSLNDKLDKLIGLLSTKQTSNSESNLTIQIENMQVRDELDIRRIATELEEMRKLQARGKGDL